MISFVVFSGETTEIIFRNLGGLIGINTSGLSNIESIYYFKSYLVVVLASIIGATPILKNLVSKEKMKKIVNVLEPVFLCLVLLISTSYIVDGSFNPFLYFRF